MIGPTSNFWCWSWVESKVVAVTQLGLFGNIATLQLSMSLVVDSPYPAICFSLSGSHDIWHLHPRGLTCCITKSYRQKQIMTCMQYVRHCYCWQCVASFSAYFWCEPEGKARTLREGKGMKWLLTLGWIIVNDGDRTPAPIHAWL